MLNLKRAVGQQVIIGEDVHVTVISVDTSGDVPVVNLGFDAPRHICIDRSEVRARRKRKVSQYGERITKTKGNRPVRYNGRQPATSSRGDRIFIME